MGLRPTERDETLGSSNAPVETAALGRLAERSSATSGVSTERSRRIRPSEAEESRSSLACLITNCELCGAGDIVSSSEERYAGLHLRE